MAQVSRTQRFDGSAEEMWRRIGGWGDPHTWHPAVADTKAEGDKRTVFLEGGGEIHETQTDVGPLTYSYRIDESPLPVANYTATIAVRDVDGGCEVEWGSTFDADGASDEEAEAAIAGIYEGGFAAL